jgi:hypothetical protein
MSLTPAERELFIQLRRAYKALYLAYDRYFLAEDKEQDPEKKRSG